MLKFIKTNIKLFLGYFIYGLAIVFMLNANIGVSPWDAFHQGLSLKTGITVGQAAIIVGSIIVLLDALFGESIGWGTITNMIFVGVFIDVVNNLGIVPYSQNFITGLLMLLIGIMLAAIATVLYLSVGLGSGPRDGLMLAIHKKTNRSISFIRSIIESFALLMGLLLGGNVGIGTIISTFLLGYAIQFAFRLVKINPKQIKHTSVVDNFLFIKKYILSYLSNNDQIETNENDRDCNPIDKSN